MLVVEGLDGNRMMNGFFSTELGRGWASKASGRVDMEWEICTSAFSQKIQSNELPKQSICFMHVTILYSQHNLL